MVDRVGHPAPGSFDPVGRRVTRTILVDLSEFGSLDPAAPATGNLAWWHQSPVTGRETTMSQDQAARTAGPVKQTNGFAVGMTMFAAIVMMIVGLFQAVEGLIALFDDTIYAVGEKWVFAFDLTTWGWIHLVAGLVVAVAGYFVLTGAVWARTVGVIVATLSALMNFAWLPHYPVYSVLVIALDIVVIWALIAHGREVAS